MKVLHIRNVNHALTYGLPLLLDQGIAMQSRVGSVLRVPEPVTTVYAKPCERVLFSAKRDANPFFHLMESLWMLAGRDDVASLVKYNARMAEFSDDGTVLHGAYGARWRHHFGKDQLLRIIELLRANPEDRRIVLQMWDATTDLGKQGKDFPCNTQVYFAVVAGALDATVMCRSNDVVWGAYGANAVQFSVLLEFVAYGAGLPVGRMWQISNNYHVYHDRPDSAKLLGTPPAMLCDDRYAGGGAKAMPLCNGNWRDWLYRVEHLFETGEMLSPPNEGPDFLCDVVGPMILAHAAWKEDGDKAIALAGLDSNIDWIVAGREWIGRRKEKST